ncbi:MAG: protein kinase [Gemmatimonadetes bacterium]|nr:protein kinase [Gemmatimonadota bacterium]
MAELLDLLREALAGRYDLQRELGRGGMATVFLAEDVRHRRLVAIKVLHPELATALGAERFLREIEIAARLQHPHILPLYDSGSAGDQLFFVMPFVEGESLRDRLTREKQLSLEDTLRIAGEVASALSYAHSHGVVHRDIKPENIMLSGGTAVVADFGIARAISAAGDNQLTQTGTVIGTPAYMSPEQATGSAEIDGRSDQYSLACVVYEMLVGEPPFTGPTPQAVIARHSLDNVSPPTIVRATIPDAVEDALLRALTKVPADRFATCALFAEALLRPSAVTGPHRRRATGAAPAVGLPRWLRRAALAAVPVVVLAAAWATRSLWLGSGRSAASGLDPRRIAVLYFQDRSPERTLSFLADGLTEALIHELSEVKALQVISRNGVAPFKNAAVSADSIARALKVGTIVDGTVEQAGDSLRLTVYMTNATNNDVIGSTTLKRSREDVVALQDDLAKEVSLFLRQRLGQEVQEIQARLGTRNARAWELVHRAEVVRNEVMTLLEAGDTAAAGRQLARADSMLAAAAALDQRWTTPIVKRGWLAYEQRLIVRLDKRAAAEWSGRGLEFATQALKITANDAEALRLRGTLRYFRWLLNLDPSPLTADQLLSAAEQDLRAGADTSNPNRASSLARLSHLLLRKSAPAEGKLAALQAYEADPYLTEAPDVLWRLFSSSLDLEDGTEAVRWCQEGRRRFPQRPFFTECQISAYALKDQKPDVARAWRLLEEYVALWPPNLRDYRRRRGELLVAMALTQAGLKDSARAVALRARADPAIDPSRDLVYIEAILRNLLGDREESLRLIGLYLATNPQDRVTLAKDQTWWWQGVRDDPRFRALVGSGG